MEDVCFRMHSTLHNYCGSTGALKLLMISVKSGYFCRYERMGNCLAMQYGGSQAHSQYFHRQRGDWNAKVQSRDLVTTLTRIYNNNLNDAEKQQAMNLFLGNFVPQPGKPAVWELGSDKHLHAGARSL